MLGPHLTNWSVRIALLLYLVSAGMEIRNGRRDPLSKYAWLGGSLCFLGHVFCAFYYHHNMSHAEAYANTAARTEEALGFAFGAGIFFSYAFTFLWLADAIWRVASPNSYAARANWLHATIHAYLFFIALNGAAVFEAGVTRWGAMVGCVILLALAWAARTRVNAPADPTPTAEANQP